MKRDWIQISTNVAVVIGLVVVIYEVNQTNIHKRAELGTVSFEMHLSRRAASLGDDPSPTLAKALSAPEELSLSEIVFMDNYNNHVLLEILHYGYMHDMGIYVGNLSGSRSSETTKYLAKAHFGYPFGRTWWASRREDMQDLLTRAVIDEALQEDPDYRIRMLGSLK